MDSKQGTAAMSPTASELSRHTSPTYIIMDPYPCLTAIDTMHVCSRWPHCNKLTAGQLARPQPRPHPPANEGWVEGARWLAQLLRLSLKLPSPLLLPGCWLLPLPAPPRWLLPSTCRCPASPRAGSWASEAAAAAAAACCCKYRPVGGWDQLDHKHARRSYN
mgnify:CR=1 FL=1